MSDNLNKQLIVNIYNEINKGNPSALLEALHNEVVWTVIGSTQYSGTFIGKDNVVDQLVSQVDSSLQAPATMTVINMVAEGDYVVVEAEGEAVTIAGKPYNNRYCEVYRINHSKQIIAVTVYLDTEAIARAF